MRTNIKFHAVAISLITLIVVVLYIVIDPKPQQAPVDNAPREGDRQVSIINATWGENCNPAIEEALRDQRNSPPVKDGRGNVLPYMPLKKVEPDNVLQKVSETCNHRFACQLRLDPETLGVDPLPGCYKQLVVAYRCFTFDRLNTLTLDQGDMLKIDCTKTTNEAAAPAGQH